MSLRPLCGPWGKHRNNIPFAGVKIISVLTCLHCGEPIESSGGVWFHPYRRFQGSQGGLPTLCDFGDRIGPSHAAPLAVTPSDRDFLRSVHVSPDEESFLLEALWLEWRHANTHRRPRCCPACHAPEGGQHAMNCERRAPMVFGEARLRPRCSAHRPHLKVRVERSLFW